MKGSRKKLGLVTVGLVAALTLSVIAVAGAATSDSGGGTASPTPSASAKAGEGRTGDGDRHAPDGDVGGRGHNGDGGMGRCHRGGGDLAEALASLTKTDVATIMAKRAAGTSFADIAKDEGVSTDDLLGEATRIETAELDGAVEAGWMTEAQRTQELSTLQAHLKEELTETHALPGDGDRDCDGDGPGGNRATGTGGGASYGPSTSGTTQAY